MLRYLMSRYKEFEFLSPSLPFMEYISFGDGGGGWNEGCPFSIGPSRLKIRHQNGAA